MFSGCLWARENFQLVLPALLLKLKKGLHGGHAAWHWLGQPEVGDQFAVLANSNKAALSSDSLG